MNRLLAFTLLGLVALARCAPEPKPPPVLNLTITGGTDQNPDILGRPSPVAVRVYQLSGTAKFENSDIFALKDREAQTLGPESQGSQEYLIAPGEKKTVTMDLKPMVSSIGVAVLYRDIDNAKWRAVQPANANGPTRLAATSKRLTLELKPDSSPAAPGFMGKVKDMVGGPDSSAGKAVDAVKDEGVNQAKGLATDAIKSKVLGGASGASSSSSSSGSGAAGATSGVSIPGFK